MSVRARVCMSFSVCVCVCMCENESVSVKDNTCRGALAMNSERVRERECEHDS